MAVICFVKAEQLAPFVVTIEPDVVSLQRTFQGVPVGNEKIYPRSVVTDLGVYVGEAKHRPRFEMGQTLSLGRGQINSTRELVSYFRRTLARKRLA